ncbi:hypothetical protein V5O48_008704 [Marasmius crinis-equi]|uniref:Pyridoxamine 5'-phosphate oxidase Alr4036 family FMN-binding domain-containing protein n=1 Tax=Marasmius crinis-equi TaxID=585013 RepID=A0ABR3FDI4_9AGAR
MTSKNWTRDRVETSSAYKNQIEELKKNHAKAVAEVCDSNVADYHVDTKYLNASYNELLDMEPSQRKKSVNEARGPLAMDVDFALAQENELVEARAQQHSLRAKLLPHPFPMASTAIRHKTCGPASTIPNVSRLRYTYLKRIQHLKTRHAELYKLEKDRAEQDEYNRTRREEDAKRKDDEERRRQEAQFPYTPMEWRKKTGDSQLRVARFLTLGSSGKKNGAGLTLAQEKMLKTFGWKVEDVMPLVKIHEQDRFRSRFRKPVKSIRALGTLEDPEDLRHAEYELSVSRRVGCHEDDVPFPSEAACNQSTFIARRLDRLIISLEVASVHLLPLSLPALFQLATVDNNSPFPQVRSHIFREFLCPTIFRPEDVLLITSTDVRTPKVTQMNANPHVQIHWYIEGTREQFRISGKADIVVSRGHDPHKSLLTGNVDWEAKRMQIFKGLSAHMKASWCRPVPGSVLQDGEEEMKKWPKRVDEPGHEKNEDGSEVSEEDKRRNKMFWEMAMGRFALIVVDPIDVDYLNMGVVPNRRYRFLKSERGSWEEEEIVA